MNHEDILAADVLLNLDEDFHVGEALHLALGDRQLDVRADRFCQRPIAVTRDDFHVQLSSAVCVSGVVTFGIERHMRSENSLMRGL